MPPIDFAWDLYQQTRINQLSKEAAAATAAAQRTRGQIASVDDRLDRLGLVCAALWELLAEHTTLKDADLAAKMCEIDARDGLLDGKAGPAAQACPACGRTISSRDLSCIYCGAENAARSKVTFP